MKRTGVISVPQQYTVGTEERTRWVTIGSFLEDEASGKKRIKIDSVPVGWDGFAHIYPPRDEGDRRQDNTQPRQQSSSYDGAPDLSSIPF